MESRLNTIAKVISFVLFPLFMPLYGLILLLSLNYFSFYPKTYVYSYYSILVILTIATPMIIFWLYSKMSVISDIQMREKEDRVMPYATTSLFFLFTALFFYRMAMPPFVVYIIIGMSIATLINAIVTIWWKISAHMTGIGGLIGGIYIVGIATHTNTSTAIAIAFLCAGLIASARLQLNKHTPLQLLAGFANGWATITIASAINWAPFLKWGINMISL